MNSQRSEEATMGDSSIFYANVCHVESVKIGKVCPVKHPAMEDGVSKPDNGLKNCTFAFFLATSAAALGGAFQFGIAIANMANTLPILKRSFGASDLLMSVVIGGNPIGGLFGAFFGGYFIEKLGRRKTMIANGVPFLVGCVLMSTASHISQLVVGRIVVGFAVGVGSVVTNIWLSEISPVSVRGGIGALYGVSLSLGAFSALLFSIPQIMGEGDLGWRLFLFFPVLPALYQSVVLCFCAESPVYLAFKKQDVARATSALTRYRRKVLKTEVDLLKQKANSEEVKMLTVRELLSDDGLRLMLAVGVGLNVGQQLSAINGVLAYVPLLLSESGVSDPTLAIVLTGVAQIFGTSLAAALTDKLGRRTLMWIGFFTSSFSCAMIGISQSCAGGVWACQGSWTADFAIAFVVLFFVAFSATAGSMTWVFIGEVFPMKAKGKGSSICIAAHWIVHILTVLFYDSIDKALSPYTFFLFAAFLFASFIAVILFMPETRQKSNEQICEEVKAQAQKLPPFVF